ncbi:hypothetical protein BH18CHL2_BH18CHL2_03340 [soil metagenome]
MPKVMISMPDERLQRIGRAAGERRTERGRAALSANGRFESAKLVRAARDARDARDRRR